MVYKKADLRGVFIHFIVVAMVPRPVMECMVTYSMELMAILSGNLDIDLDSTEEYYSSDPTGIVGT